MLFRVTYLDFHSDNYQGGSGKTLKLETYIDLPHDMMIGSIINTIESRLSDIVLTQKQHPTRLDIPPVILKIQLIQ